MAGDVVAAIVLEGVDYADRSQGSQRTPPALPLGNRGDSLIVVANEDSRPTAQRMLALNHALALIQLRAVSAAAKRGGWPIRAVCDVYTECNFRVERR